MGTLLELPEWLPEPVREYVEFWISRAGDSSDLMIRLAKDLRMRPVWETLKDHVETDQYLADYFGEALSVADHCEMLKRRGSLRPAGERRQLYPKIRKDIDSLIHFLEENGLMITPRHPEGGYTSLLHAFRDSIDEYESVEEDLFSAYLPRKMRAKNAMRSFFMRSMKDRVRLDLGRHLYQVVADTTNVVFNSDVTPEDVRKA